ncbi:MAG: phosphoenolpyruvate carboxylase [Acidobacteriota bacterium]
MNSRDRNETPMFSAESRPLGTGGGNASSATLGSVSQRLQPLRDDVRLLGSLLGEVLQRHAGSGVFDTVEEIRGLSKAARHGDEGSFQLLADRLAQLKVEEASQVAQAFAHFLNLANVAEQHHRIRRRRAYRRAGAAPQHGSCEEVFRRLLDRGVPLSTLQKSLHSLDISLVLTAHPTEVVRRTLLERFLGIAVLLQQGDREDLTQDEENERLEGLRREIAAIWHTRQSRRDRPTPLEEAQAGLVTFEKSLWEAYPRFLRQVDRALVEVGGEPLPWDRAPVRFGSWMGGDRDGNPFVTSEITERVCALARWEGALLFRQEIEALRGELSMERGSPELETEVGTEEEPYRALLRRVVRRLAVTQEWMRRRVRQESVETLDPQQLYLRKEQLLQPLLLCDRSLRESGCDEIADGRLRDILRRLAAFGLTLVRLDIRQDAGRHRAVMERILSHRGEQDFASRSEQERCAALSQWLDSEQYCGLPWLRPEELAKIPFGDDEQEVVDTMLALRGIGNEPLGSYIISMAKSASDVLIVELLLRCLMASGGGGEAEGREGAGQEVRALPVVPLIETGADLEAAGETIHQLLAVEPYRRHLGEHQEVMIGYSDSAKDAGRFAASWGLYTAQEAMAAAANRHGIKISFFHGRGGSVGRGGGPTALAVKSLPPGTVGGRLRVTEQGEMIRAKFGLEGIAVRTLEVYLTSILETSLVPPPSPEPEWREAMDRLAERAQRSYRELVREHPDFVPYFRQATPEVELGALNIGSRPARRRSGGGVESLRAIPWVFAWTQTRLLLPSWLGTGEALHQAVEEGEGELLSTMYREWGTFRSVLALLEMVLAKAEAPVAAYYDRLLVDDSRRPLGVDLRRRLGVAEEALQHITGEDRLLASNPVLRRSIDVRNPYVDPLNVVQAEVLRRLRVLRQQEELSPEEEAELVRAFTITVNGIAAGMRNTG